VSKRFKDIILCKKSTSIERPATPPDLLKLDFFVWDTENLMQEMKV